jgi:hypothetical protein
VFFREPAVCEVPTGARSCEKSVAGRVSKSFARIVLNLAELSVTLNLLLLLIPIIIMIFWGRIALVAQVYIIGPLPLFCGDELVFREYFCGLIASASNWISELEISIFYLSGGYINICIPTLCAYMRSGISLIVTTLAWLVAQIVAYALSPKQDVNTNLVITPPFIYKFQQTTMAFGFLQCRI